MTDFNLTVESWQDKIYEFELENEIVKVKQYVENFNETVSALHFEFELELPVRFSVRIMIPRDTCNACAVLNSQLLISPFGSDWPQDGPDLNLSDCQKKGAAVSTIKPGEFQKVNFRWQQNDHLVFYRIRTSNN